MFIVLTCNLEILFMVVQVNVPNMNLVHEKWLWPGKQQYQRADWSANHLIRAQSLTQSAKTTLQRPKLGMLHSSWWANNHAEYECGVITMTQWSAVTATTTWWDHQHTTAHFLHLWQYIVNKFIKTYRKVSNIRRTLVGNKIVDHSDVVGASPVGAAPTTSSFST